MKPTTMDSQMMDVMDGSAMEEPGDPEFCPVWMPALLAINSGFLALAASSSFFRLGLMSEHQTSFNFWINDKQRGRSCLFASDYQAAILEKQKRRIL